MSIDEYQRYVESQPDDSAKHDALYEAHERIRQLEALNATLAAQMDRQAKVVDASLTWAKWLRQSTAWKEPEAALEYTVREYQREMAQLAKDGE